MTPLQVFIGIMSVLSMVASVVMGMDQLHSYKTVLLVVGILNAVATAIIQVFGKPMVNVEKPKTGVQ